MGRTGARTLRDLQQGEEGHIREVKGGGSIRQRLLDMGILPDRTVRLERVAPSGDPIWIVLNGNHMALRREEASAIVID
jgi:Fe2+ transport system protein FeoA